jgi:hypothetical protein
MDKSCNYLYFGLWGIMQRPWIYWIPHLYNRDCLLRKFIGLLGSCGFAQCCIVVKYLV